MTRFGAWREYVVLSPSSELEVWFVGWLTSDAFAVSQIPLYGPVRLLRGPNETNFFAVNQQGEQIPIQLIGSGRTGDGSRYAKLPLR